MEYTHAELEKFIKRPLIKPRYRISVLNPDESVNYVIPSQDIPLDGISYTEEYQNGQRRNITLKLINNNKKYTPSINGIWLSAKFSYDVGLEIKNSEIIWFPKGVYVMGDISYSHENSSDIVTIQLKDKYSIFDSKQGTLEDAYEIELDSNIIDALDGIRNFSSGDGYILDYKPILFDASFISKTTQNTIRIEEGQTLGNVIDALATQLSAEYYYNEVGNLCFYPLNETTDDSSKPVIWVYENLDRELHNVTLSYKNDDVINIVNVVGDNVDNGIHSASVSNTNPSSPICVERIGKRVAPKYTESNVWSDDIAYDLANYYLRQYSTISVGFSCAVSFNPLLTVNNICEVENHDLVLQRDKLLITSISYSSTDGRMTLNLSNTADLPQTIR